MPKDSFSDLFPPSALDGVLPELTGNSESSISLFDEPSSSEQFPIPEPHVYTVSELLSRIRTCLDMEFATVLIEGEISSFSRAPSGHCYFTIREGASCLKCVMFRSAASSLSFSPSEGDSVTCRGELNIYAGRGDLQLVVQGMEPSGRGLLYARFQELKARLEAEGLFDPDKKQEIPPFPRRIFLVTSPAGAAVRDFIKTARGRWSGAEIILVPTRVQGDEAIAEIVHALGVAEDVSEPGDVIVVTRGGGSIEDLWAFNEEAVVRRIAALEAPVVSGVGHETDFTLADYAADFRAATPTAAAVAVTPDAVKLLHAVDTLVNRAVGALNLKISRGRVELHSLRQRLKDPASALAEQRQRVDEAAIRMEHAIHVMLGGAGSKISELRSRLLLASPDRAVSFNRNRLESLGLRLSNIIGTRIQTARAELGETSARLESVSPLAVLSRGYSLVREKRTGKILRDASEVTPGDTVLIRPHRGEVECEVKSVVP